MKKLIRKWLGIPEIEILKESDCSQYFLLKDLEHEASKIKKDWIRDHVQVQVSSEVKKELDKQISSCQLIYPNSGKIEDSIFHKHAKKILDNKIREEIAIRIEKELDRLVTPESFLDDIVKRLKAKQL